MVEPVTTSAMIAGGSQVLGGLFGGGKSSPSTSRNSSVVTAFTGEFNPVFGQTPAMTATASLVPVAFVIAMVAGVWAVVKK